MKSKFRSMTAILVIAAMMVTCLPVLGGSFEASAASGLTSLKAAATGKTTTTITWKNNLSKKQKKAVKGIAVFRNNKVVRRISKNATSFKDSGLKAGTSYTYQLKTYKYKKVKVWYNKKTKKWQTKKPVKKYRGKSKKKNVAVYSNPSARKTVKTKSNAGTGGTGPGGSGVNGTGGSGSGGSGSGGQNLGTKTVIDFKGVKREITKHEDSAGVYWTYKTSYGGEALFDDAELWLYDKTVNGGNSAYKQVSGATFQLTGGGIGYTEGSIATPRYTNDGAFRFNAYNVDPSKLQVKLVGATIENVSTYFWDENNRKVVPRVVPYVKQNGKRIAVATTVDGKYFKYDKNTDSLHLLFYGGDNGGIGSGIGIYNGTLNVEVKYDGQLIGTAKFKTCNDGVAANGMTPSRRKFYAVAEKAINGKSTGTIWGDYKIIARWIESNLTNPQSYNTGYGVINRFDCIAVSGVLETWLIYNYGESAYGFVRGGIYDAITHRDYCLNSDPATPMYVVF